MAPQRLLYRTPLHTKWSPTRERQAGIQMFRMRVFRQVDAGRDLPGVISHNAFLSYTRPARIIPTALQPLSIVRSPR